MIWSGSAHGHSLSRKPSESRARAEGMRPAPSFSPRPSSLLTHTPRIAFMLNAAGILKCASLQNKVTVTIQKEGPCASWQVGGKMETGTSFSFGAPKSLQMVTAAMKLKDACSLKNSYDQSRQQIKAETLLCRQRSVWSRLWFFLWSRMDVRVGP